MYMYLLAHIIWFCAMLNQKTVKILVWDISYSEWNRVILERVLIQPSTLVRDISYSEWNRVILERVSHQPSP